MTKSINISANNNQDRRRNQNKILVHAMSNDYANIIEIES